MTRPKIKTAPHWGDRMKDAPHWSDKLKTAKATGRDADPRRTIPLNSTAWRKLRASVLAGEPLCRDCNARGLLVEATDVDHISGPSDNSPENLQPLCHSCHSRKTARDHGKNVAMGCDEHGMPLDPSHPWFEPTTGRTAALLRPPAVPYARARPEITKD